MKYWLALATLICFGSVAQADNQTFDVNCDSITVISTAAITTYAPVFAAALVGTTTIYPNIMPSRKWIELDNLDTTRYIMVGFGVNPSTTPANWLSYTDNSGLSSSNGKIIAPAGYFRTGLQNYDKNGFPIIPVILNLTGGTAKVSVIQCGQQ